MSSSTSISFHSHSLCISEDGQPIRNDQQQLVFVSKNDPTSSLVFLDESREILEAFGLIPLNNNNVECQIDLERQQHFDDSAMDSSQTELNNTDPPSHWRDDNSVKYLIHLRHEVLQSLFRSTALSNAKKWEKLALELRSKNLLWSFTGKQCEAKYKELKKLYNKWKDSQGDRCSGGQPVKFRFCHEMDEHLHASPTVRPLSVASSMNGPSSSAASTCSSNDPVQMPDEDESCSSPDLSKSSTIPKPQDKNRKSKVESGVKALREVLEENYHKQEEAKERRHREFLSAYTDTMNRLIDKL